MGNIEKEQEKPSEIEVEFDEEIDNEVAEIFKNAEDENDNEFECASYTYDSPDEENTIDNSEKGLTKVL